MSTRVFAERERSHQAVLPIHLNVDIASPFALPDQSGGLDWTAAGTKLALRQFAVPANAEYLDYRDEISIDGNDDVVLAGGLWYIRFFPVMEKTGTGADAAHIAITNAGGTTVHREVGPLIHDVANPHHRREIIEWYLDVPAAGEVVSFRASQVTAGTDISIPAQLVGAFERVAPLGKLYKE